MAEKKREPFANFRHLQRQMAWCQHQTVRIRKKYVANNYQQWQSTMDDLFSTFSVDQL